MQGFAGRLGRFGSERRRVLTSGDNQHRKHGGTREHFQTLAPLNRLDTGRDHRYTTHSKPMPKMEMPSGALILLILRVLRSSPLHGYAIAQRIHALSADVLRVEEGSLYPALQRILLKGWAKAEWGISETNRKVRFYKLTPAGRKQLDAELSEYERVNEAIRAVLNHA